MISIAELISKLKVGTDLCTLYSDKQGDALPLKVSNIRCYATLGPKDENATKLKVNALFVGKKIKKKHVVTIKYSISLESTQDYVFSIPENATRAYLTFPAERIEKTFDVTNARNRQFRVSALSVISGKRSRQLHVYNSLLQNIFSFTTRYERVPAYLEFSDTINERTPEIQYI